MQELIAFSNSIGFAPSSFNLNGNIHRFDRQGKKNAWYVGFQCYIANSGEAYQICVFGDWKTGERHEYKPHGKKFSKEDKDAISKKMSEAAFKSEEERRLLQSDAAVKAGKILETAKPTASGCDYLARKKIELNGALTVMDQEYGRLVAVPMSDIDGKLWGLQRIYPDGGKRFLTGQKVVGTFFVMGNADESFAYLCEGFATGASIRQATGRSVFVAFNAGNLVAVAKEVRRKWPNKSLVICGDDDKENPDNPGRKKAEEAAKLAMGTAVFPDMEGGTDFNDLHILYGLETVKSQLSEAQEPDPSGYIPLGYDEGQHFFYDLRSKSIKKTGGFSSTDLFQLMPLEYWEMAYPCKRGGVNWNQASSDMIQRSKTAGPFDSLRIRGTGVWLDGGRTVINTGCGILSAGKAIDVATFKTHYVYVQTKNRMPPIHTSPLTKNETRSILTACENLCWTEPKSGHLLAGWIAIARIAGALPIRPHIWLTGGSGAGKSTVMDKIIRPALGSEAGRLYLQGGTTEAGVRQSVKADSVPIIFDEFESTSKSSQERTHSIIELMRQSWSHTQGHVVKGSPDGVAAHYVMSFAALVSSIRVTLDTDADKSRFAILELAPHGSDSEQWRYVKEAIEKITEEYGERLFSRSAGMIQTILASYEILSTVLATTINQRFGQQYGMLLAGWYSLLDDGVISVDAAKSVVDGLAFVTSSSVTEAERDEDELLNHIMTSCVTIQDGMGIHKTASIESYIADSNPVALKALKNYGIVVESDFISIANHHAEFKTSILRGTKWEIGWSKSLARIDGALPTKKRFGSDSPRHCISIPRTLKN